MSWTGKERRRESEVDRTEEKGTEYGDREQTNGAVEVERAKKNKFVVKRGPGQGAGENEKTNDKRAKRSEQTVGSSGDGSDDDSR